MKKEIFVAGISKFKHDFQNLNEQQNKLLKLRDDFNQDLSKIIKQKHNLSEKNPLTKLNNELVLQINQNITAWNKEWDESSPMRKLSEFYQDRIILLIFGKVNAGKSSFCNMLVEELKDTFPTKLFHFSNGKVEYFNGKFQEGCTETTARIQGVEIGSNLVILDSPGLHSVTDSNVALTRKFTDSADAVIWLTPSSSPGQTQELNDLTTEIENKKVLLPVITKSDIFEEDVINGSDDIVKILINKSMDNRKDQIEDVMSRAREYLNLKKLPLDQLRPALALSAHWYKQSQRNEAAENESGFADLYVSLCKILSEATRYKSTKAAQQVINYLDNISTKIREELAPAIINITSEASRTMKKLESSRVELITKISADAGAKVHIIVNRHTETKNKKAIISEVSLFLNDLIQREITNLLSNYIKSIDNALVASNGLSENDFGDFEDIKFSYKKESGGWKKGSAAAAGSVGGAWGGAAAGAAAAGAALGTWFPVIGTAIGAVLGGLVGTFFGSAAGAGIGETFVDEEEVEKTIGVDNTKVIYKIQQQVNAIVEKTITTIIKSLIADIHAANNQAEELSTVIQNFANKINQLKGFKHE